MNLEKNYDRPPQNGSCKGQKTSMWFPKMSRTTRAMEARAVRAETKMAIEICNSCIVSKHCLEYSLRHEPYGIWGGKTEEERAVLRGQRGIVSSRDGKIHFSGLGSRSSNSLINSNKNV